MPAPSIPRRLFNAIGSIRLAVISIAWLAAACLLSTLIPQGRDQASYASLYPGFLAWLIGLTGLGHFLRSWSFFLPAFLFLSSLSTCAVQRCLRELGKQGPRRHGPDLLHLGLVLLAIGSIASVSSRQGGSVTLAAGDSVDLPGGRVARLLDLSEERYPDGRPRAWTSVVRVERGGKAEVESFAIRVNHPLRVGGLSLYQYSFGEASRLVLVPATGPAGRLFPGDRGSVGGLEVAFLAEDDGAGRALLQVGSGPGAKVLRVAEGEDADGLFVAALRRVPVTGLKAVSDPAWPLVLAALVLSVAGLVATFLGKQGAKKP